jgi:hypothetical protein
MARSTIERRQFEYEQAGQTFLGSYTVEQNHLRLTTPHGPAHAALNIQTEEQIIEMLLQSELGGKLIRIFPE